MTIYMHIHKPIIYDTVKLSNLVDYNTKWWLLIQYITRMMMDGKIILLMKPNTSCFYISKLKPSEPFDEISMISSENDQDLSKIQTWDF
jgi:hypothetical protein